MYKNANLTLEMLDSGIDSLARIQIDTFFLSSLDRNPILFFKAIKEW